MSATRSFIFLLSFSLYTEFSAKAKSDGEDDDGDEEISSSSSKWRHNMNLAKAQLEEYIGALTNNRERIFGVWHEHIWENRWELCVCVCMSQSSLVSQNLKHSQAAFSSIHMGRYFRRKLNFSLMWRHLIFSSQTVAFSLSLAFVCEYLTKFTVSLTKNAWSSVRLSYLKWVIWLQISQISFKVFTKNDLLKCRGIFSRDSRATSTCNSENSLHSNNFASHTFMFY